MITKLFINLRQLGSLFEKKTLTEFKINEISLENLFRKTKLQVRKAKKNIRDGMIGMTFICKTRCSKNIILFVHICSNM